MFKIRFFVAYCGALTVLVNSFQITVNSICSTKLPKTLRIRKRELGNVPEFQSWNRYDEGVRHRVTHNMPLCSSFSFTTEENLPKRQRTSAVHALILASVLSYAGDQVFRSNAFRALLYLKHSDWRWWQLITSTFCHAGGSHLSGNIFLLLLFGRSVEEELGAFGLVFSYLFCGVVSNLVSLATLPTNTIGLGASGAVFGLFSVSVFSRLSWRDLSDWRKLVEVGVLGQYVVGQIIGEVRTAASGGISGVNHVAHLSGAGAGIVMILVLRKMVVQLEKNTRR